MCVPHGGLPLPRAGGCLEGADLGGADLSPVDLSAVDLSGADIAWLNAEYGARFSSASPQA
ncbi:pentapeptide repeat-containing protein [Wenjunlia tyrosinilytica]|uniref:Pentapeptide repeat-containing protein n=1 Tax=Wenjunlia tyrosinilytica TaxID=1544741 RepID=A0A918DZZ5_9ACTN|nr:hypothetical protein GCM10012280_57750 [Wenjunlia tyrosinilytica]